MESTEKNSQKRISDLDLKSCKKIRSNNLKDDLNEEQNLHKDSISFVGSVSSNIKLDSDSVVTITLDDDSVQNTPLKEHCESSSVNSKERTALNNISYLFSNSEFQAKSEAKNVGKENVPFTEIEKQSHFPYKCSDQNENNDDDEIQILFEEGKVVPIIDLTDDSPRLQQETAEKITNFLPDLNETQLTTLNSDNIKSSLISPKSEQEVLTCNSADRKFINFEDYNEDKSTGTNSITSVPDRSERFQPGTVLDTNLSNSRKSIVADISVDMLHGILTKASNKNFNTINSKAIKPKTETERNVRKKREVTREYFDSTSDTEIKVPHSKKVEKTNGYETTNTFYGNRVTNRGAFFTEPVPLIRNKNKFDTMDIQSEEFHKLVESPDINIEAANSSMSLLQYTIIPSDKNPVFETDDNMPPVYKNLSARRYNNTLSSFRVCNSVVRQKTNLLLNASSNSSSGNASPFSFYSSRSISPINLLSNSSPPSSIPIDSPPPPPLPPPSPTCLIPQHLKTLIGNDTIESENVLLLMIEWKVEWFMRHQQFQVPPPISINLKNVVSTYESFEDYYNTYFPLMLLDTWQRMYVSWIDTNLTPSYSCQITSYVLENHYVRVKCETIYIDRKVDLPEEGSILIVKYTTTFKVLGYLTQVKKRPFDLVMDSHRFGTLKLENNMKSEVVTLTFIGAFTSNDIHMDQPIHVDVLCNVNHTLKQNDALLFINESPLLGGILNPAAGGIRSLAMPARNSSAEEVSDWIGDITEGILSSHSLTVVRAKPECDRYSIIPRLVEKIKRAYSTQILLCVREIKALNEIAANISLKQTLNLVIINKRGDTQTSFRKFLLNDLVSTELKKEGKEDKSRVKVNVKSELFIETKKEILSECDVVLSLVRYNHDDIVLKSFAEKERTSQLCCIVDEAHLCTEPETLIPISYGITKLILIGDPDHSAKVSSEIAKAYDYKKSFFKRAHNLNLPKD